MSKIFLSGGGDMKASYPFDELFFNSLPQNAHILYIPVAMATTATGKETCFDWFSKLISNHSSDEQYLDFTMWNGNDPLPRPGSYDAVYVGGGNTYRLMAVLEGSGMLGILREYIKGGGTYYGGSAGAVIIGKSLRTVEEENLEHSSMHKGMDLINDLSVIPHFSDSDVQKNTIKHLCDNHALMIAALPEDSGLIIDERGIRVYGKMHLYGKEKETLFYTSGQIVG